MEYKDHSHNHLDEGIISGLGKAAGSAARTVGRAAVKSKGMATTAGSAVKTGAAAVTKPVADRVKKGARSFNVPMRRGMGPEGRVSARKAGGFLKNQITDPLKKLGRNALMNPALGDEVHNRTGGFKGATNRMQDAIFGKDAMDARRVDAADVKAERLSPRHWSQGARPKTGSPTPTTPAPPSDAAAPPHLLARPAPPSDAAAPPPSGEQSSTGGPRPGTRDPQPGNRAPGNDDSTDPQAGTRSPSVAARVGGAVKQSMQHNPEDPGRRFRAVRAGADSVNRGIGGNSPQSMKNVFVDDPNSIKLRPTDPEAGEGITPEQEAMARRIMRTANISYGEALGQVLSSQQGVRTRRPRS